MSPRILAELAVPLHDRSGLVGSKNLMPESMISPIRDMDRNVPVLRQMYIKYPCLNCACNGQVVQQKRVTVPVPAGVDDGQTVRNKELSITFNVWKSRYFRRHDFDVLTDGCRTSTKIRPRVFKRANNYGTGDHLNQIPIKLNKQRTK
ncbi:protein tumorous imaginal discs, mitochondrial-like [Armigeres subalbatus]|uniref:protein tumorous imaginal discs, mitochondrial-like n=1 Tax=Armigeres subalbatus TaxID=124917 RepID=UPI002ED3D3B3